MMKRMVQVTFPPLHTQRDKFLLLGHYMCMLLMFFPKDLVRRPSRHDDESGPLAHKEVYGSLVRRPDIRPVIQVRRKSPINNIGYIFVFLFFVSFLSLKYLLLLCGFLGLLFVLTKFCECVNLSIYIHF